MYDLLSHEVVPLLEGYAPIDVSPDGLRILLKEDERETGDLFILDLAQPEEPTLLQENVGDAAWLGDSGWIAFTAVSKAEGVKQVFVVHPDGSDLTQMTHSAGAVPGFTPVSDDGFFWRDGAVGKWTKLDGSEQTFAQANSNCCGVSPGGKYLVQFSYQQTPDCLGCNYDLIDIGTGEKRELILSKPSSEIDFGGPDVQPLSDDIWLVEKFPQLTADGGIDPAQYWLYSSTDGSVVASLPGGYDVVGRRGTQHLSPDGIWLLLSLFKEISDEEFTVTYHLLNTETLEIKDLPNLSYTTTGMQISGNRMINPGSTEGTQIEEYAWVALP